MIARNQKCGTAGVQTDIAATCDNGLVGANIFVSEIGLQGRAGNNVAVNRTCHIRAADCNNRRAIINTARGAGSRHIHSRRNAIKDVQRAAGIDRSCIGGGCIFFILPDRSIGHKAGKVGRIGIPGIDGDSAICCRQGGGGSLHHITTGHIAIQH